jgi:hypothetical protein
LKDLAKDALFSNLSSIGDQLHQNHVLDQRIQILESVINVLFSIPQQSELASYRPQSVRIDQHEPNDQELGFPRTADNFSASQGSADS